MLVRHSLPLVQSSKKEFYKKICFIRVALDFISGAIFSDPILIFTAIHYYIWLFMKSYINPDCSDDF